MTYKIIISGFGGQGVLFAGNIICQAGLLENKHVTFFPSYGAEMRGGTANCQVIISDSPIGSPVVENPDILLSFNKPSFLKFSSRVKNKGFILVNSSLFNPEETDKKTLIQLPANRLAEKCGSTVVMNIVMVGALVKKTGIVKLSSVKESFKLLLTKNKKKYLEINKNAAETGYTYLKE